MPELNFRITKIVVSFDISGIRIDLFDRATITVVFKCDDGETIVKDVVVEGEEYLAWGSDDEYITKYITENIHNILEE